MLLVGTGGKDLLADAKLRVLGFEFSNHLSKKGVARMLGMLEDECDCPPGARDLISPTGAAENAQKQSRVEKKEPMPHLDTWPAKVLPRVPTLLDLTSAKPGGLDRLFGVGSLSWPGGSAKWGRGPRSILVDPPLPVACLSLDGEQTKR